MADSKNFFTMELEDDVIKKFIKIFKADALEEVDNFLNKTRLDWRNEFIRQQASEGDGTWPRLGKTTFKNNKKFLGYADRKKRDFEAGKIHFNSLLKRNGTLMNGYISGMSISQSDKTLTINYPLGVDPEGYNVRIRAKSHQNVIRQPKGVPARPFNEDKFTEIAFRNFADVMEKQAKKKR